MISSLQSLAAFASRATGTLALVMLCVTATMRAQSVDASGDAVDAAIPIESLLRPDGTINRDRFAQGAVDLRGWHMTLDSRGEPRFVRESAETKSSPSLMVDPVPGDEAWDDRFGPPGINGPVYALAVVGTELYIGGKFTIAGNALATNIARWDGTSWYAVGDGVSGPVYVLAVDGNTMYIGGQFLSAGTVQSRCIVQLNLTTKEYVGMRGGVYAGFVIRTNVPTARVHAIAIRNDSVFVGGLFFEAGLPAIRTQGVAIWSNDAWSAVTGYPQVGIVHSLWNGFPVYALSFVGEDLYLAGGFPGGLRQLRGTVVSQPIAGGTNDTVFAMVPSANGLYLGGQFTQAGAIAAQRIAHFELPSGTWSPVGDGFDGTVYSLAVDNDELYAGGKFTHSGFARMNAIARWSSGSWGPVGGGLIDSAGGSVHAMLPVDGGLYAGGRFRIAGRATAFNVAFWNRSQWRPIVRGGSQNVDRNGADGPVYAMAVRGSDVYVGGDFSRAGGEPARRVAKWNGEQWSALGDGIDGADALVRALAIDSSGTLYVGGIFSSAGGVAANGLARWDGTRWSAVGAGGAAIGGDNPYVFTLAVQGNTLIAGGAFTRAGGQSVGRIARYDIATGQWSALGAGLSAEAEEYAYVAAIAIDGDAIYAGGSFTRAGGLRALNIARYAANAWSAMGTPARPGVNGPVSVMLARGDTLIAGGVFTMAGADSARYLARWHGGAWTSIGGGMSSPVSALTRGASDELVAGGEFTRAGTTRVGYIARWNGTRWVTILGGTNGPIRTLARGASGVYAGGDFTLANGQKANNVTLYDYVGYSSLGSDPSSGLIGTVLAIAVSGSDVYIGGLFASAGGVRASGVARWDGRSWLPLGAGVDGPVRAIAVHGDDVYVAGEFTNAGGAPRRGIARWNRVERTWSDVGGGLEGNGPYGYALAVRGDDVYLGGSFTGIAGVSGTGRIARWNVRDKRWYSVGGGIQGSGYYTYVSAIAIDSLGRFYAGGIFPSAGEVRANNIAMFDGSSWQRLGRGVDNVIYDIAVMNNDIYVAGEFHHADELDIRRIARWDGSGWSKLGAGTGPNYQVFALAVHRDLLYAAGEFLLVDNVEAHGIARWNGSTWRSLGSGVTNSFSWSGAYALAVDDSAVYVGGYFTIAGRHPSYYFARFIPSRLKIPRVLSVVTGASPSLRMLREVAPNPTTGDATIRFALASRSGVRIDLFAPDGTVVASNPVEHLDEGEHRRTIRSHGLPAGAYLCRLSAGGSVETVLLEVVR